MTDYVRPEDRVNRNTAQYARMLVIQNELQQKQDLSRTEIVQLAQRFNVSERTVYRDLDQLTFAHEIINQNKWQNR
jgi:DeoR/GlpR family transcriptional regulator of sugar metabolism